MRAGSRGLVIRTRPPRDSRGKEGHGESFGYDSFQVALHLGATRSPDQLNDISPPLTPELSESVI
jgi:hypothetical protein